MITYSWQQPRLTFVIHLQALGTKDKGVKQDGLAMKNEIHNSSESKPGL